MIFDEFSNQQSNCYSLVRHFLYAAQIKNNCKNLIYNKKKKIMDSADILFIY